MNLPPKTKEIIDKYMDPVNDRNAPLDSMVLSLYMQVSRFLCWHRVKVKGEFPMLYAFNFAPSGAYKDRVMETLLDVINTPLAMQSLLKKANFESQQTTIDMSVQGMNSTDARAYRAENKVIKFNNTFRKGTPQGFQKGRKGAEVAQIGHIHYESSEFLDSYRAKDSNTDSFLSLAKDAWNRGYSSADVIAGEWREHVSGVPMTLFLHGSSAGLKENPDTLKRLLGILETGIAKRAIILFNDNYKRKNRTMAEKTFDTGLVEMHKGEVSIHFQEIYDSICAREYKNENKLYKYKTIDVHSDVEEIKNDYQNKCNDKADTIANDILQIEMRDRFWRALRLSACIATLEHPDSLVITKEDYEYAMDFIDDWGDQFRKFLMKDQIDLIDSLFNEMLFAKEFGLTDIKKKLRHRYSSQVQDSIKELKLMADERGKLLIERKGIGVARYYTLIDIPDNYKEIKTELDKGKGANFEMLAKKYDNCADVIVLINNL